MISAWVGKYPDEKYVPPYGGFELLPETQNTQHTLLPFTRHNEMNLPYFFGVFQVPFLKQKGASYTFVPSIFLAVLAVAEEFG